MEEMERMRSDISQLTKRVDDFSLRLATVEVQTKGFDDKLDSLKELLDLKLSTLKSSIDGWNRIGFWLLTAIGGAVIAGVVGFMLSGGFRVVSG
jgi:hypothetical protein